MINFSPLLAGTEILGPVRSLHVPNGTKSHVWEPTCQHARKILREKCIPVPNTHPSLFERRRMLDTAPADMHPSLSRMYCVHTYVTVQTYVPGTRPQSSNQESFKAGLGRGTRKIPRLKTQDNSQLTTRPIGAFRVLFKNRDCDTPSRTYSIDSLTIQTFGFRNGTLRRIKQVLGQQQSSLRATKELIVA